MMSLFRHNNFKSALLVALYLSCAIFVSTFLVRAETAQSPLPAPTGYVNDFAGVIDADTKSRLEAVLENLKKRADIEFAVATVKTTGGTDIYAYALAVARGWGIGDPDGEKNGLLLLVAIDDHKYYTQPSRHLEGDLPDSLVGQIQREKLVPQFKQQNYSQGLYDTVEAYVATLAEKRGFSVEGIDQKRAYREPDSSSTGSGGSSRVLRGISPCAIIFVIIVVLLLFSGRGRGGGGSGCLNMFLLGSLLNSGRRGGWGSGGGGWSSGWGGGGFGGSGGGGGGGFGGFGGGGDFGGGGAGGSW